MRQVNYRDGTPSREVEEDEDWEATGQEEMNRLHAECKQKKSIIDIRDALNNLNDLIDVCGAALLGHENTNQERIQRHVAHVLCFYVHAIITDLEKELERQ